VYQNHLSQFALTETQAIESRVYSSFSVQRDWGNEKEIKWL